MMRGEVETGGWIIEKPFFFPKAMENIFQKPQGIKKPSLEGEIHKPQFFSSYVWWLHMEGNTDWGLNLC